MQAVTREPFHNDAEHSPRRRVRFATEEDVQFIAASSLWAEINDLTRTLAQFRNNIAQLERDGFVVPHFHQQCGDLEARIAVLTQEQSSSSLPSSPSKKAQVVSLSRPFDGHVRRHRLTKTPARHIAAKQSVDAPRGTDLRVVMEATHIAVREKTENAAQPPF